MLLLIFPGAGEISPSINNSRLNALKQYTGYHSLGDQFYWQVKMEREQIYNCQYGDHK